MLGNSINCNTLFKMKINDGEDDLCVCVWGWWGLTLDSTNHNITPSLTLGEGSLQFHMM